MTEPWLSAESIAPQPGITKDTVYVWMADKKMPTHRVGRLRMFQAHRVDEWVRSDEAAPEAEHKGGDS